MEIQKEVKTLSSEGFFTTKWMRAKCHVCGDDLVFEDTDISTCYTCSGEKRTIHLYM